MNSTTPTEVPAQPGYRALLIGVDDYQKRPLSGCVNDIDRVQAVLLDRLGVPVDRIRRLASPLAKATHSMAVPEQPATLDNIRSELAALARDAQAGERVFIYFSGHGGRALFDRPDGRAFYGESLIPVDVDQSSDKRVLANYELNSLLRGIVDRTSSVSLVLDCCHSAGATRDPGLMRTRRRSLDLRSDLGWTSPLRTTKAMELPSQRTRGNDDAPERTVDDCHVVAACLNHELAAETEDNNGVAFGVLTEAFIYALRDIQTTELSTLAWARIWQSMRATMSKHNRWQNPWMSGNPGRAVFSGPPFQADAGIPVQRDGGVYRLDAGTLASVGEGAKIAVYGQQPPVFPPLGSPDDIKYRCGVVCVTQADRASATASAEGEAFQPPPGARGRVIEVGKPARLTCAILPDDAQITNALKDSPLIEVVTNVAEAKVRLEKVSGYWLVTDDKHDNTLTTALVVLQPPDVALVREVLEHYYLYALPLRMAEATKDLPGALDLRVLSCDRELSGQAAQEAALPEAGPTLANHAGVCFRVRNTSDQELRVTLLNSAASGRVQLIGDQVISSNSSRVFWAGSEIGKPFAMSLPQGKQQGIDRLTAIGTTVLAKDLGYLKVSRKFADILAAARGPLRGAKDIGDDDDARNSAPVERWTSTSAVLITRDS